jgi:methylated-DNA-protein-cysteine methyltransferase-like protein
MQKLFCGMATDIYERIYDIVRAIPRGKVTTYGHIAAAIGSRGGARLVGWALNAVAHSDRIDIPCHRVVNRLGELSGKMHFETPHVMRERLQAEDVQFQGEAVDMRQHLWVPPTEA